MFQLLHQPYPIDEPASRRWLKAAMIGAFVGVFLLLFQPFGIQTWKTELKELKVLGFGLITFVLTAFHFFIWPVLFPQQFSDDRWTVGREILLVTVIILTIGVGNRLYLSWLIGDHVAVPDLMSSILITFLIGVFPVSGTVLANYIIKLKRYSRTAAEIPLHTPSIPEPQASTPTNIILTAENEKDTLHLSPTDLLFIESSDNYCTVHFLKNNQPTKLLLRSSLSRLEGQISVEHIVRCHRSFVVNLNHVERVTGNAQGYKLHLLAGTYQVPVARKYNDTLVAELKAL